jgi:aminopeptidase YwaD
MKYSLSRSLLVFAFFTCIYTQASAQRKADKKIIKQLRADIEFLASDALEGRRTGTEGERKSADYIESRYQNEKIDPYRGNYRHPFQFVYGKELAPATEIKVGGEVMKLNEEVVVFPFSSNTKAPVESDVLPEVLEEGDIWIVSLYSDKDEAENPHFDWEKAIVDRTKEAKKLGAKGVIFYDAYNSKYAPAFNAHSDQEALSLPVAFLPYNTFESRVKSKQEGVPVSMNIAVRKTELTGNNIAAYVDNKAPYTVILGAHYDHLGYGDGGSLYTGKDKQIHNGADDNASGTAGILQLASWVKKKRLRNYNYLFVNFSGEELGLYGSKAFVKDIGLDSSQIAYMINLDMIGRLNDSTHALTVGGVGTSPVWGQFITKTHREFKIAVDSSGVGPSDHTSFYHAGIPVLFFFTGLHHDYHKPTDDADKVNYGGELQVLKYIYSIIDVMDTRLKPAFTPTKQSVVGKVKFKVTLGIMPDYTYQEENGIRVDGVSEDRPAIRAGIKAGDIITQLGDHKIKGMQSYMEALGKFKEGDTTKVTLLREGKPLQLPVKFTK